MQAAALQMAADRAGAFAGDGRVFECRYDNLKGAFINAGHKAVVKITQAALRVGRFDLIADQLAAGNDDFITAAHPKQRLDHALDEIKIQLVLTDAVGVYPRAISRNIAVVALDADDNVLTFLLRGLAHLPAEQRHRDKLGIEYSLNLHILQYLR